MPEGRLRMVVGCWCLVTAALSGAACSSDTPVLTFSPGPASPPGFTTYTDEQGVFSLAYPQEWELGEPGVFADIPEFLQESFENALPKLREIGATFLFLAGITHIKLPGSKQRTILDESYRGITHGCRQPSNQAHKTISRRGELAAPGSGGGFHHVCTPFKLLRARTSPLVASLHL